MTDSAISVDSPTVIVDNSSVGLALDNLAKVISSGALASEPSNVVSDEPVFVVGTPVLKSVNVSSERLTAANTTGFKSVMLGLIGDYESVVTDYTYQSGSYVSHSIDITPDYSWIAACLTFVVVVFCVFRLIGGLLCSR